MTDTQIQVLVITFLLAAAIVLPLTYLAYKKEQKKNELKVRQERDLQAREKNRRQVEEEDRKREEAVAVKRKAVASYEAHKARFAEIRSAMYSSPACGKCGSNLVHIVELGEDTGVLTARCTKCDTERRIYALSKESFGSVARELITIMAAYNTVRKYVPDYPGLAVSFPVPAPRA